MDNSKPAEKRVLSYPQANPFTLKGDGFKIRIVIHSNYFYFCGIYYLFNFVDSKRLIKVGRFVSTV